MGGGQLHPPLLSAHGWLQLGRGDRDVAARSFAAGRREAEGGVLHRLLCARFEIRAWDSMEEAEGLRDAAMWMLGSESGSGPSYEALAEWALARADALDGRPTEASERARVALRLAEEAGDEPTIWRAATVLAEVTTDPAEAADLRSRATGIVHAMAKTLVDTDLEERFLAQPAVAALLDRA